MPNIEGEMCPYNNIGISRNDGNYTGAFEVGKTKYSGTLQNVGGSASYSFAFDASLSNPIYGSSNTVQPPALTLLPCIKAFNAETNPGLIAITGLANDVTDLSANKLDKTVNGTTVKYVTETYDDGTNWYRKWSDGWLEQGGHYNQNINNQWVTTTLLQPYVNTLYIINVSAVAYTDLASTESYMTFYPDKTTTAFKTGTMGHYRSGFYWSTAGQGAQS